LKTKNSKRLVDLTARGFTLETASESPAPGGGSVSAYMGALGAALGTMVAIFRLINRDGMKGGNTFQTGQKKARKSYPN
jgi:hypothetical protein